MKAISYTEARQGLAKTMREVCEGHEPIIITRQNQPSVVMVSVEEYQALEETAHLLRSPKNMRRLLEAIEQLESGGGSERGLSESDLC